MEPTTQSPPATGPAPETTAERQDRTKPLPATEKDYHTRPSRTQSSGFRIAIVIAIIVLLVIGFFAYRYFTSYESTDDAQVDGHINSVSARISGHVIKLNVQDNQYVSAGTVLVEIDPADYQLAYERAKADYADAQASALAAGVNVPITSVSTSSQVSATEADVNSARAGIEVALHQYQAAKAQLQQAEANDVKAQNDLGRYKQLVAKQEISHQQYRSGSSRGAGQRCRSGSCARHVRRCPAASYASARQAGAGSGELGKCQHRTQADADHTCQSCIGAGRGATHEGQPGPGATQFAVHQDRGSRKWHRQ